MIALLLLAAHMVGDYILQTDWMAANKLHDWRARLAHVFVYTSAFSPVGVYARLFPGELLAFLAAVFVTHFVTDSRRWASGAKWPPKPILVDQSIHVATLAALGVIFGL